jgi:hypothetical protein
MTNKVEQLIAIVKEYPIMYNMTLPEFKDMRKKDNIFNLLFCILNININK